MARNALKLSTMVEEYFEICISEMTRNALKMSIMVGENFEIGISEMALGLRFGSNLMAVF